MPEMITVHKEFMNLHVKGKIVEFNCGNIDNAKGWWNAITSECCKVSAAAEK